MGSAYLRAIIGHDLSLWNFSFLEKNNGSFFLLFSILSAWGERSKKLLENETNENSFRILLKNRNVRIYDEASWWREWKKLFRIFDPIVRILHSTRPQIHHHHYHHRSIVPANKYPHHSLPRFPLTAIGNSIDSNSIAPTSPNPMRKTQTITLPNDNSPGRQSVRHHSHASSHSRSSSIGTTIPPPFLPYIHPFSRFSEKREPGTATWRGD